MGVGAGWGRRGHREGEMGTRRVSQLLTLALVATMSGCWLQIGADGGHTRFNATETTLTPETVAGLHQVWQTDLGGPLSEPMISQGRVFVTGNSSSSATVYAVRLDTGAPLWTTTLASAFGEGSIVGA